MTVPRRLRVESSSECCDCSTLFNTIDALSRRLAFPRSCKQLRTPSTPVELRRIGASPRRSHQGRNTAETALLGWGLSRRIPPLPPQSGLLRVREGNRRRAKPSQMLPAASPVSVAAWHQIAMSRHSAMARPAPSTTAGVAPDQAGTTWPHRSERKHGRRPIRRTPIGCGEGGKPSLSRDDAPVRRIVSAPVAFAPASGPADGHFRAFTRVAIALGESTYTASEQASAP